MDERIQNRNPEKSKKRRILFWIIFSLVLLILGTLFLTKDTSLGKKIFGSSQNETPSQENLSNTTPSNNDSNNNENSNSPTDTDIQDMSVSENYKVKQIRFGGNVIIEDGKSTDTPLEVYQVKSETVMSQEDDEPRLLITWKTSKLATSTVAYAKNDGTGAVEVPEEGYGFEHSLLIKNMEFSNIYTYKIESKDKWGNKKDTEYFSAYTGDKSASVFDLIVNAVEDVFGWAM